MQWEPRRAGCRPIAAGEAARCVRAGRLAVCFRARGHGEADLEEPPDSHGLGLPMGLSQT